MHEQPAYVRVPEAAVGVVRVIGRVHVLVVQPVVPRPPQDAALVRDTVQQHQQHAHGSGRLIRAVCPQPDQESNGVPYV